MDLCWHAPGRDADGECFGRWPARHGARADGARCHRRGREPEPSSLCANGATSHAYDVRWWLRWLWCAVATLRGRRVARSAREAASSAARCAGGQGPVRLTQFTESPTLGSTAFSRFDLSASTLPSSHHLHHELSAGALWGRAASAARSASTAQVATCSSRPKPCAPSEESGGSRCGCGSARQTWRIVRVPRLHPRLHQRCRGSGWVRLRPPPLSSFRTIRARRRARARARAAEACGRLKSDSHEEERGWALEWAPPPSPPPPSKCPPHGEQLRWSSAPAAIRRHSKALAMRRGVWALAARREGASPSPPTCTTCRSLSLPARPTRRARWSTARTRAWRRQGSAGLPLVAAARMAVMARMAPTTAAAAGISSLCASTACPGERVSL